MKLEQLYYFTEAVKAHSISVAARKNFVPQSTVSTAITKLEKELGTSLLKRSNKGVTPTEIGLTIAEKSKEVFVLLDEIKCCASSTANEITINISAMPSLVDTVLADLILEVKEQGNLLKIDMVSDEPRGILQSVQLGLADIGIMFDNKQGFNSTQYPDLKVYPLFTDTYCLFVGKKSPFYIRDFVSITEALSCPHIAYKTEFEDPDNVLTKLIAPYGIPKVALRVDNTESMRRLITKSEYVAFFPYFTIYGDAYIESQEIRAIPISDVDLKIYISYIESNLFKDFQGNELFKKFMRNFIKKYEK